MGQMTVSPWQLNLFRKSIKKKEKIRLILNSLSEEPRRLALELGCSQGLLGYFFRQKKGFWISADEDLANLQEAKSLLGSNLIQLESSHLPFLSNIFDLIICPDYLEHVEDDQACLEEIARLLKPGGQVILVTPQTGPGHFLYRLRSYLGLNPSHYGHKREGYHWFDLQTRLQQAGLRPERQVSTSRFFSEGLELLVNFFYVRFLAKPKPGRLRDGHIRPMSEAEFKARRLFFQVYSLIYPFFWLTSRLDSLISFSPGYLLFVWAKKPAPQTN